MEKSFKTKELLIQIDPLQEQNPYKQRNSIHNTSTKKKKGEYLSKACTFPYGFFLGFRSVIETI